VRRFASIYSNVLPTTSYYHFHKHTSALVQRTWIIFAKFLLVIPTRCYRVAVPKNFWALLGTTYMALHYESKAKEILILASSVKTSRYFVLKVLTTNLAESLPLDKTAKRLLEWKFSHEEINAALDDYAFWNLNHQHFGDYIEKRCKESNQFAKQSKQSIRFLTGFETNMGHLSCLYMYVNYFARHDPTREVVIGTGKPANGFFLNLIKRHTKIPIHTFGQFRGEVSGTDTLLLQQRPNGNLLRIGPDAAFFGDHDFSDWRIQPSEEIRLQSDEILRGYDIINSHLSTDRWLVALHIRGPKTYDRREGQVRDADISDYKQVCEAIWDLGGMVIRMGDTRFPPFSHKGVVFDYAHSSIRSEFMDCWLWNEIKFWVGNSHGASIPPMLFGKRRVMTNQWYWNLIGGEKDFVLPKVIRVRNRFLTPRETVTHILSRRMQWNIFFQQDLEVVDNPPRIMEQAVIDTYHCLQGGVTKSTSERSLRLKDEVQSAQHLRKDSPMMNIPPRYADWYFKYID